MDEPVSPKPCVRSAKARACNEVVIRQWNGDYCSESKGVHMCDTWSCVIMGCVRDTSYYVQAYVQYILAANLIYKAATSEVCSISF